jgi:hypothetical protein
MHARWRFFVGAGLIIGDVVHLRLRHLSIEPGNFSLMSACSSSEH